jgi:hypothetical protein
MTCGNYRAKQSNPEKLRIPFVKTKLLFVLLLTLFFAKTSFASPVSGCSNTGVVTDPSYGDTYGGDGVFTCSFYPSDTSYTISLYDGLTDGGTVNLYLGTIIVGPVTPGYVVVINGDPSALADNSLDGVPTGGSGLFDQSLWAAVLWFQPDTNFGTGSDEVTVYYAGDSDMPSAATVDASLYTEYSGYYPDSAFFVQSGNPAVYGADDVYNVYPAPTPEPPSLLLFGTGLTILGGIALRKRIAVR